jgi:hypothetical protein
MEDKTLQAEAQKPESDVHKTDSGPGNPGNKKENPVKNDTDTEPDEFIGPDADTDLPIDGQVVNDAVLRGEPHADSDIDNLPLPDKNRKPGIPPKKDTGNL